MHYIRSTIIVDYTVACKNGVKHVYYCIHIIVSWEHLFNVHVLLVLLMYSLQMYAHFIYYIYNSVLSKIRLEVEIA